MSGWLFLIYGFFMLKSLKFQKQKNKIYLEKKFIKEEANIKQVNIEGYLGTSNLSLQLF